MASRVRGKASEAERHASQEALSGCCPTRPDSHPQIGGHPRCVKPAVALTPEGMMPAKVTSPGLLPFTAQPRPLISRGVSGDYVRNFAFACARRRTSLHAAAKW